MQLHNQTFQNVPTWHKRTINVMQYADTWTKNTDGFFFFSSINVHALRRPDQPLAESALPWVWAWSGQFQHVSALFLKLHMGAAWTHSWPAKHDLLIKMYVYILSFLKLYSCIRDLVVTLKSLSYFCVVNRFCLNQAPLSYLLQRN